MSRSKVPFPVWQTKQQKLMDCHKNGEEENASNKSMKWDYTSLRDAFIVVCKKRKERHKTPTWGKTDDTMIFFCTLVHIFLQHQFYLWHPIYNIFPCIRFGCRHSKTQLRMMCSSRNFLFETFWWPTCDKSTANKFRLSLYAINWIGSHGISHSVNGKSM